MGQWWGGRIEIEGSRGGSMGFLKNGEKPLMDDVDTDSDGGR